LGGGSALGNFTTLLPDTTPPGATVVVDTFTLYGAGEFCARERLCAGLMLSHTELVFGCTCCREVVGFCVVTASEMGWFSFCGMGVPATRHKPATRILKLNNILLLLIYTNMAASVV
jgi:hypothetical protein